VKYTCSMETVQQNGRFTLFSIKFLSIYFVLYVRNTYLILHKNNVLYGRNVNKLCLRSTENVYIYVRHCSTLLVRLVHKYLKVFSVYWFPVTRWTDEKSTADTRSPCAYTLSSILYIVQFYVFFIFCFYIFCI